jgi:hypothetical protein
VIRILAGVDIEKALNDAAAVADSEDEENAGGR